MLLLLRMTTAVALSALYAGDNYSICAICMAQNFGAIIFRCRDDALTLFFLQSGKTMRTRSKCMSGEFRPHLIRTRLPACTVHRRHALAHGDTHSACLEEMVTRS